MATAPRASDPLKVLDQMLKDVLVHTGKALKETLKDGPKSVNGASGAVRNRAPDTMVTYHSALDDLESEITRAKAVLTRDLEKLRAARLPAPAPVPKAPVMDLPSSAAHTTNPPPFVPNAENKPVAPFPDMGTGDVVDLTLGSKKPSPRVPPGSIKPSAQPSPSLKNQVKPSPKMTHKSAPKAAPKATPPAKVTPVPPPQIPRLYPPQPAPGSQIGSSQAAQPRPQPASQRKQSASPSVPRAQAAQVAQNASLGSTLSLPSGGKPSDANAAGGELNFTDMQFSLAPSANESQNAPPAPMPEFDLTTFAPQDGSNNLLSMSNFSADGANASANTSGPNGANHTAPPQAPKEPEKPDTNLDDLFNLPDNGSGGDNMDLDLDLGTGGATDSNFEELFSYTDMGQFDNAYFGLE